MSSAVEKTAYPSQGLKSVDIPTANRLLLKGLLGLPIKDHKHKCNLVIFVHGFAAEKTENGLFLETAGSLVEKGYTVLAYDWQGLGESEGDFSETDLDVHVKDFLEVASWVERETGISASETCAVGFSLGATIVGLALQKGANLAAVAYWSPATSPSKSMWPRYNTSEFKEQLKKNGYITKPETNVRIGNRFLKSLKKTDLGTSAFELSIPLLICHGTGDTRIPISNTRKALKKRKIRHGFTEYIEFSGASHSFRPEHEHRQKLKNILSTWLETCGKNASI